MRAYLILGIVLATSFSAIAAEQSVHWGYEGQENPERWGQLSPEFALCETGKNQSPINIQGALKTHSIKPVLNFQQGKQEIINNGHTIQINVSEGNNLRLDDDTFALQQFHFHAPGENEIDGKQFPLEAHLVYKNKEGSLVVLALMFQKGKANPQLDKAWQQMPDKVVKTAILTQPVDIHALLPENVGVYRFSGSLTTPPCSEGVTWLVLEKSVTASADQISKFHLVLKHANNRPLQPLNGRVIIN